MSMENHF